MSSYFVVEPSEGQVQLIRKMAKENVRIKLVIHEALPAAMSKFSNVSVDYLHVSPALLGNRKVARSVLQESWDKVRPGGVLSGGFPRPGTRVAASAEARQEVKLAVAEFSKSKHRQASFALDPEAMAWMIRR